MKRILKKVITIAMAAALMTASLAGCQEKKEQDIPKEQGNSEGVPADTASDQKAMGRYLEEDIQIPEGILNILAIQKQQDKSVNMATSNEAGNREIWNSTDAGKTWTKKLDFPTEIQSEANSYLVHSALSSTGEMAFIEFSQEGEWYGSFVDQSGKYTRLNVSQESSNSSQATQAVGEGEAMADEGNTQATSEEPTEGGSSVNEGSEGNQMPKIILQEVLFNQKGELFMLSSQGIYKIDTATGEIKQSYSEGDQTSAFGIAGDSMVVLTNTEVKIYDVVSGKQSEKDKVLEQQIKESTSLAEIAGTSGPKPIVFQEGVDNNSIYYTNSKGLFYHTIGGTITEQVIDGALNTLGSPSTRFVSMTALEDQSFMITFTDDDGFKMMHYVYSKDTPTVPGTELKVYSLEDNMEVRQAIAQFQKKNPDICVTMEIGMTGDNAVTASDAIRTLNTNIMADKGPDIMVLDGIPVKSYVEKGLLTDLSNILAPIEASDGLQANIKNLYETDGKIYAIPTRFKVPAIQAEESIIDAVKDLTTLADQAEQLRKDNPDVQTVLTSNSVGLTISSLYDICSASWEKEDGSLDEAKLKEFFTLLKRLYEVDDHTQEKELLEQMESMGSEVNDFKGIGVGSIALIMKNSLINIGEISTLYSFAQMLSINEKAGNLNYTNLNGQTEKVIIPGTTIGISSKSTKQKEAESFLAFLLSKDAQLKNQGGGFPINKAAFHEMLSEQNEHGALGSLASTSESGEMLELMIMLPKEEEIKRFEQMVAGLEHTPLMDRVIRETVEEQAYNLVNNGDSVEKVVDAVMQKVNLYLVEQQ